MPLSLLQTEFTARKAHVLQDRNALRGLLNDCLSSERAKVNQLWAAVECGALDKVIDEGNPGNPLFKHNMAKLIEGEHGYAPEVCAWVVDVWVALVLGTALPDEAPIPKSVQRAVSPRSTGNTSARQKPPAPKSQPKPAASQKPSTPAISPKPKAPTPQLTAETIAHIVQPYKKSRMAPGRPYRSKSNSIKATLASLLSKIGKRMLFGLCLLALVGMVIFFFWFVYSRPLWEGLLPGILIVFACAGLFFLLVHLGSELK